jgi:hypothetical protein
MGVDTHGLRPCACGRFYSIIQAPGCRPWSGAQFFAEPTKKFKSDHCLLCLPEHAVPRNALVIPVKVGIRSNIA